MDPKVSKPALPEPDRRKLLTAICPLSPTLALGGGLSLYQEGPATSSQTKRTTKDRIALALMRFGNGFHCSQSLLEAYAEDFGLDPHLACRLASAPAGGSTVGGECGAVASGYLVLGLKHGNTFPAYGDVDK